MVKQSNTIEVIGAGYSRTGTASLQKALGILGYNSIYDRFEVSVNEFHDLFWCRVSDKEKDIDFDEIFCDKKGNPMYRVTCDFPSAQYWKEQLQKYPNAKVILTIRDPEKWYASAIDTFFCAAFGSPYQYNGLKFLGLVGIGILRNEFWLKIFRRDFFQNEFTKEHIIKCYNDHNKRVINECPKEKLLIFDIAKDGWEPLCKFLNKPIPSEPFPHVNDTKILLRRLNLGHFFGEAMMAAIVVIPMLGIAATIRYFLSFIHSFLKDGTE